MEGKEKSVVWRCEKAQDRFEASHQPHPRILLLFNKLLDLGKSRSCLEGLLDLYSTEPWTQPRDNGCTPGCGKGLIQH